MSKPRTIMVDGVELRAATVCKKHGVSRQLYSFRLDSGWDEVEAAVTLPGYHRSGPSVPPSTTHGIYARVRRGWDREAAAIVPLSTSGGWNRGMTFSPTVARVVADVEAGETIASVARKHGVNYSYVWQACSRRGISASRERKKYVEAVDVTDGIERPLRYAAEENGVSPNLLASRRSRGWPAAMAAILPLDGLNRSRRERK